MPKVAFVQTEQSFKVPENDPWGNEDSVFYRAMLPGKDYDNSAISCGNGAMYRKEALLSIGGFSAWNLVEDVHTSMLLHSKGWVSVYHEVAYTQGTAPSDVVAQVKQRWQWAVDSLRMFFWDSPLFKKGLNLRQRLQYFHFGYHYVTFGLFLPIFFLLPICALFTHQFMLPEPLWRYVLARLPYFLFYIITNQILTQRLHSFKVFQAQAGLFGAYFDAFFTALFSRRRIPQYTVTRKIALRPGVFSRLYRCFPHIVFVLLSLGAIVYGASTIENDIWFLGINVFWALWTVAVLSRFIVLSLWPRWFVR
ncbi:MAG: glycosyltransferase [Deltaproteobacteria bacterium]|nr:glycosyltransferase [Deltaproteobacteria bacterium]